ncbi:hypothetical protein [Idiomarina aminovorans]|uniref:hypothetical protein n=1 Tax=Idiomarina aminovorans TaxID=2914829 RepID=UPI00200607FE|nr:hypothetical protein [Idiomarina sp. ATCH4]MCK7458472.1 hypothetical protein [Idiomarina sp. ATCH4]
MSLKKVTKRFNYLFNKAGILINMKTYGLLFAISVTLMLAGCASPTYNYAPKTADLSFPEVGSVAVARVGDKMLSQGKYVESEAIKVLEQEQIKLAYTIFPGYFLKQGEDDKASYYKITAGNGAGRIEKSALADMQKAVMVDKNDNEFCVVTWLDTYSCDDEVRFEKTMEEVVTPDSFQQTLIYNGKVGDKINVGYREFSSNMVRDAFRNEVEYDLSESNIIGYQGAQIEVVEATNQKIKYRVISNFN